MKKNRRKVEYVQLKRPPKVPSLPSLSMGGQKLSVHPRGSVIRTPSIQPEFKDIASWGWWMQAFPQSSFPEYLCMWALVQLGNKMVGCPRPSWRGQDVVFQKNALSNAEGLLPGVFNQTVVDFLVVSQQPPVAIFVDGLFFHLPTEALDISKRTQLQQYTNWQVITIDDISLLQDSRFFVKEALAGRGYSHLRRNGL